MNIVFFTDSFWPNVDGVATSTYKLAQDLAETGNSVTVVTLGKKHEVVHHGKLLIIYLKAKEFSIYPDYTILLFPPMRLLSEYIDFSEVDLIHVHAQISLGFPAYIYSRIYKIPLIATFHTLMLDFVKQYLEKEEDTSFYRLMKKIGAIKAVEYFIEKMGWRWLSSYYKLSDIVIAPSDDSKSRLKAVGVKHLIRIYNGIIKQKAKSRDYVRKKYGLKNKFVVLHVGRLSPEKRVDLAIKVFKEAQLKDAVFVITSKGPQKEQLQKLAQELDIKDKVVFTGYINEDELSALYQEADVFFSPSLFEVCSIAAGEALIHKKPMLCAQSGGNKDLVKNNYNGFSVTVNSRELHNYTEKLRQIYLKKGMRRKFAENSGKMSQKLSYDNTFKSYVDTYKKMKNRRMSANPGEMKTFAEYLVMNYFILILAYMASKVNNMLSK